MACGSCGKSERDSIKELTMDRAKAFDLASKVDVVTNELSPPDFIVLTRLMDKPSRELLLDKMDKVRALLNEANEDEIVQILRLVIALRPNPSRRV